MTFSLMQFLILFALSGVWADLSARLGATHTMCMWGALGLALLAIGLHGAGT